MSPVTLLAQATLSLGLVLALPACADELPQPADQVLLTVSGDIEHTNGEGVAAFDRAMLEKLGAVEYETSTIWTEGLQTFTGVPLAALMEAVGARGETISATAVNDYAVQIPASDWDEGKAIVAYLQNGNPMSLRDKGPLWVVYPYDSSADFQTEVIYSRSIWQLDRIEVTP